MSAAPRAALDFISHSPDQTRRFGQLLGRQLACGDLVLVGGQLGSGKTTLIQGIGRGLGVRADIVSPTFTIVMEHQGQLGTGDPVRFYHIDLYRLAGTDDDLESIGFDDYLSDPGGIVVIEWPERAAVAIPERYLMVDLERIAESKRRVRVAPSGDDYQDLVANLRGEVGGARG